MSRWTENFSSHPVHQQLRRVVDAAGSIDADDPSLLPHAAEIARFRKVLSYIEQALIGIDPELLPLSFWDSVRDHLSACADQAVAFNSSKSVGHIQSANQSLDNILLHVRPYVLAKGRLGPALQSAAKAYSEALNEAAAALVKVAEKAAVEIDAKRKMYSDTSSEIEAIAEEIKKTHGVLISGASGTKPLVPEVMQSISEINEFHGLLTVGKDDLPSLRQQVSAANEVVQKAKGSVESLQASIVETVNNLTNFEARMLGALKEDGKREGGLNQEIGARVQALADFEKQQQTKYSALNQQIEALLPGATSAGLATAYKKMRDSFSEPIKNANRLFYWSVAALVIVALVMNVDKVWFWGLSFQHPQDWLAALRAFVHKLPFYGPLVWLAYYASKRRSEFQRLEQEYAHKEALAMSYESYRKQIDELGGDSDELMRDLLARAVDAIAFNASGSLDGKHGDKIPVQELIEKAFAVAVNEAKKNRATS